jgi:SAM-dependent methyltransferase
VSKIPFNKVCEIEDFSDPELIEIIRDVFKHEFGHFPIESVKGRGSSKQWEIAMSIRALKRFGAFHRDATILGVGAGTEVTSFYLTNHVKQVFATDLYLNPGVWSEVAPTLMTTEPESFAPYAFDRQRLVVQHMDGRLLQFPDNTFDGIFSSGSIEHFGSLDFIANAAYEMGRVLKPGGILTLATEFKLSGPPGGDGWDTNTFILAPDRIRHYIIEASGLEPVDEFKTTVSEATMLSQRNLLTFLGNTTGKFDWRIKVANYPNLVLVHEGYVFCSVHLALRKTGAYPVTDNHWAQPALETRRAVEKLNQQIQIRETGIASSIIEPSGITEPAGSNLFAASRFSDLLHEWDIIYYRARNSRFGRRLPKGFGFLYRTYLRIRFLGKAWDAQNALYRAFVEYQTQPNNNPLVEQTAIQMQQSLQRLNQLETQFHNVEQRLTTMWQQHHDDQFEAMLREQTDQIKNRIDLLETHLRDSVSQMRLLEYTLGVEKQHLDVSFDFTAAEVIELIYQLEQMIAELRQATAVDISIQNAAAEDVLAEVSKYFDDRLSAKPAVYRLPNDAWYHFDFTPNWNREGLLKNAARKLVRGGIFGLITHADATEVSTVEELEPIYDGVLSVGEKRVCVWVFRSK